MSRFRRLARRLRGGAVPTTEKPGPPAERKQLRALREHVAALEASLGPFRPLDVVAMDGTPLSTAVADFVRTGRTSGSREYVRAFCHALMEDPEQTGLGHLGLGVFLTHEEIFATADACFAFAGSERSARVAPVEYFLARFETDEAAAEVELTRFLEDRRDELPHADHLKLLNVLAKHQLLPRLVAELPRLVEREAADPQLGPDDARLLAWLQTRLEPYGRAAPALAPGVVSVAVMDYKLLDRTKTSSNRGDYVQTLAALANLCRFSDVEFVGDPDLAPLLTELQGDVRSDRRIAGTSARVRPVALDRDFSSGRSYPDNTWLLCNGWFMHKPFRGDIDFPFPETVNPLFLSFHVQDPYLLTPEVAARLKPYEPIGCRDWTTVYRLADVGVQAFFSGCITATVEQVMPPVTETDPDLVAAVDAKPTAEEVAGKRVLSVRQSGDYVRDLTLAEGVRDAKKMLTSYLTAGRVVTRRLHCYLPCRSMGLDVDFRPKDPADIRYEGLVDLSPEAFSALRSGLEERVERIFTAILRGGTRDEVMALWRELAAPDVAAAEEYRTTYPDPPRTSIDVPAVLGEARATSVSLPAEPAFTPDVTLAFAIDQNLKDQLAVVLQSISDTTTAQVRVHLMGRGLDGAYYERLHRQLPHFAFTFYDFGKIDYGDALVMLDHITVSTMDRLFLPELLAGDDKVLYLDSDILVDRDVAELFALDLGDDVLAAKMSTVRRWKNMVRTVTRGSLTLPAEQAWVMRRRLHDTHDLLSPTFNAGVLLLNLALMREEGFTENYLYLVETAAFNDQEVLNLYAGRRMISLEPEWNHVPAQDLVDEPRIIHWAGPVKPWNALYVWGKPRYEALAARTRQPPP